MALHLCNFGEGSEYEYTNFDDKLVEVHFLETQTEVCPYFNVLGSWHTNEALLNNSNCVQRVSTVEFP